MTHAHAFPFSAVPFLSSVRPPPLHREMRHGTRLRRGRGAKGVTSRGARGEVSGKGEEGAFVISWGDLLAPRAAAEPSQSEAGGLPTLLSFSPPSSFPHTIGTVLVPPALCFFHLENNAATGFGLAARCRVAQERLHSRCLLPAGRRGWVVGRPSGRAAAFHARSRRAPHRAARACF